jgi:trans-aconitate methyltransferase
MKEMSTDEYNKGWDTKWDQMKVYGPYARHLRRIIFAMVQSLQFETVLDVGCGQGSLLADLHNIFPRISLYGTDFSPTSIIKARQRLSHGEFLVMDLTQIALNRKFDLVVCTDVLEHIEDDITALSNLARMTNSYVLIATIQGRMRSHEPEAWGHVRNYAYGELAQKMQQVGLRIVRSVEWGFPFFSPLYRDVNYLLGGRGTGGQYGVLRKTLAQLIYQVFRLNSNARGDEIIILAEPLSPKE